MKLVKDAERSVKVATVEAAVLVMSEFDKRVRSLLAAGKTGTATTLVLRALGPEVLGFFSGVLGDADGDEVFSALKRTHRRHLATKTGSARRRAFASAFSSSNGAFSRARGILLLCKC